MMLDRDDASPLLSSAASVKLETALAPDTSHLGNAHAVTWMGDLTQPLPFDSTGKGKRVSGWDLLRIGSGANGFPYLVR